MVRVLISILLLAPGSFAQITLSEVLSNEPAGRVRLEWVEIYNRSGLQTDLQYYRLVVGSDTTSFPAGSIIDGGEYGVIARQLLAENGSDSFEGHWGDSSGVWGDSREESYSAFDGDFGLNNNSGTVTLIDSTGIALDSHSWYSPLDDGRSEEKSDIQSDFSEWHNCFDPDGSTPGEANSAVPLSGEETFRVEVSPKLITLDGNNLAREFTISIVVPPGGKVSVDAFDDSGLKRRSIISEESSPLITAVWDGRSDSGDYLPPGIYVLAIELSGQRAKSKFIPLVIAP